MTQTDKIKLVNQGYMWGLACPTEFRQAILAKVNELKTKSNEQERWTAIAHGFDLAIKEKQQERAQQVKQLKSRGRTKLQGRSR